VAQADFLTEVAMEHLHNGFTIEFSPGAFPLSTDSVVLSGFVRLGKAARVLDLGSGCGTLGMLLCASDPGCTVTGIELDEKAHHMAEQNAHQNGISDRLNSICGDVAAISEFITPGSFSACVSNPPYFCAGPQSLTHPTARREDRCGLKELFHAAAWGLKYGGDFYLVHRPERLAEICAVASKHQLEPKRLCLVRHRAGSEVALILLQCRKGGKPGLIWEELTLHNADGTPTDAYRQLYHL
jgi:tRNA1Val (adenine37-N6)-methyltransferase